MMGRWRSGAPLALCPLHDDPELGADPRAQQRLPVRRRRDRVQDAARLAHPARESARRVRRRRRAAAPHDPPRHRLRPRAARGRARGRRRRSRADVRLRRRAPRAAVRVRAVGVDRTAATSSGLGDVKDPDRRARTTATARYSIPRRPIPRRLQRPAAVRRHARRRVRLHAGAARAALARRAAHVSERAADEHFDVARRRRRTGGARRRPARGRPRRAHGARHARRVRRHGGERRAGAGADAGACGAADARRAAARALRHRGRRAGARLSAAARARARGRRRRARARRARAGRSTRRASPSTSTRARRASSTRTRVETRARTAPSRRQDHPLHRRRQPAARRARLRADRDAQRRLVADRRSRPSMLVHRRRRDRRAGRLDLQRLRHARPALPGRRRASCRPRTRTSPRAVADGLPRGRASRCTRTSAPIESFEKTRARRAHDLRARTARATAPRRRSSSSAVGWTADTAGSTSRTPASRPIARGFVRVDAHLRTSAPHVFAAGDVTGRLMLVAAGAAGRLRRRDQRRARRRRWRPSDAVAPIGSFTDPEYAQVGLTEAQARERRTTSSSRWCGSTRRRARSSTGARAASAS